MHNQETLFRSDSCEWETPLDFFRQWDEKFHFDLDVCATPENAKCTRYFTREDDGLAQDWTGHVCWMNPPYGRGIINWMRKAYESALGGGLSWCASSLRGRTRPGGTSTPCGAGFISYVVG